MQVVQKITIWVRGDNDNAAADAFDEAVRRYRQGNVCGNDVSDSAAFYFHSTTNVPDNEIPYMGWPEEDAL